MLCCSIYVAMTAFQLQRGSTRNVFGKVFPLFTTETLVQGMKYVQVNNNES